MSKIFAINAGSSSLKCRMFEMPEETTIMEGVVERIGKEDAIITVKVNGEKYTDVLPILDHEKAVHLILERLNKYNVIKDVNDIKGVGHRVVHGGEYYNDSVVIDKEVEARIEELSALAPLHNPANLNVYRIMRKFLPNAIHTAVFDTAFHQTMKKEMYIYPIPYEYYENHKVRKYGFHGTSHKYVSNRMYEILNDRSKKVITCHLGNGCSVSAVDAGQCINTSMGFTPLAGLMMGTRSGEIDPAIIPYIMEQENLTIDETINVLNKKSGVLGVSQVSSDMRDIEDAVAQNNELAILATEIYTNKIAETIASYTIGLRGLDAIVFTAGVGENDKGVREAVINKLSNVFGIYLNEEANNSRGKEVKISTEDSKIPVYVIPTNEELVIARDTYHFSSKELQLN